MKSFKSLDGEVFGKLRVICRVFPNTSNGQAVWRCVCSCGGEINAASQELRRNSLLSCGCIKHQYTKMAWQKIQEFSDQLDPRWLSFKLFLEDMGDCQKNQNIFRISSNEDFCKENCYYS